MCPRTRHQLTNTAGTMSDTVRAVWWDHVTAQLKHSLLGLILLHSGTNNRRRFCNYCACCFHGNTSIDKRSQTAPNRLGSGSLLCCHDNRRAEGER